MLTDIQITIVQQLLENFNPDVSQDQALQDLTQLLRQYQHEILLPDQQDRYVQQLAGLSTRNPEAFSRVSSVLRPDMLDKVQTAASVKVK